MSRSAAERPSVGVSALSRTRPRYGRLVAACSAFAITFVSLLGGLGVLPDGTSSAAAAERPHQERSGPAASLATVTIPDATGSVAPAPTPSYAPEWGGSAGETPALPDDSGTGTRVVFDMSDQRVWLVEPGEGTSDEVKATYLVSGSLTNNLSPGTFEVYSRSRWAVGIDDSGVMEYFVRFTRGANAAIGFHSIPTKDGRALQTTKQLGTPQSHGCIRQALPDAKKLWAFAPVGTKVVVTA